MCLRIRVRSWLCTLNYDLTCMGCEIRYENNFKKLNYRSNQSLTDHSKYCRNILKVRVFFCMDVSYRSGFYSNILMSKFVVRDKRQNKKIEVFCMVTFIWPFPLFVSKELTISYNVSQIADLHRVDISPMSAAISKWHQNGITRVWRCKNDLSDIEWSTSFRQQNFIA